MNSKSVSSEMINLEDALSNQNTSGIPVKTFVGYNCGNRTFTILMSLFDMLQYTEVANAQSKNSSDIAQRPLDLKHATAIAKYLLKGLLNTVYNKRITQMMRIYSAVLDGEFGIAAALSTILLVSSGLCVYVVLRFSQSKESAFV